MNNSKLRPSIYLKAAESVENGEFVESCPALKAAGATRNEKAFFKTLYGQGKTYGHVWFSFREDRIQALRSTANLALVKNMKFKK